MKHKKQISITLDQPLSRIMDLMVANKSRYIEYLIYNELEKLKIEGIEKIIIL